MSKMKITKRQLRGIIKEAYSPALGAVDLGSPGMRVEAKWTRDGLTLLLHSSQTPIRLSSIKDAKALITMLEELIAGPMRTMG